MFLMMSTLIRLDRIFTWLMGLLHFVKKGLKLVCICESSPETIYALKFSLWFSHTCDLTIVLSTTKTAATTFFSPSPTAAKF